MTQKQRTLSIRTPEGIVFPLELASPIARFLALVIDKILVMLVSGVITMLLRLIQIISTDLVGAAITIATFAVSLGYPIVFEWFMRGQTPGKKYLRLQVMDEQGLHLKFSQVVIRNLLRLVDALPAFYLVGGVASLVTVRAQRLGDVAANTIVIQHRRLQEPDLDQLLPDKFNSFHAYPHLAARLRQNMHPRVAGLALQALLRRDALEENARLRLFAQVRNHMERIVTFPLECTEGVSDEQYVRNAVDVVFR